MADDDDRLFEPPKAAGRRIDEDIGEKDEFGARDYTALTLKNDHANRPIWVGPDGHIFLESFSPVYKHALDFLITISEPVCRPEFVHEYKLTSYSLYAAVSVGLQTNDIIEYLKRLSKTSIPENVIQFIKDSTLTYGKLKLVLRNNSYFVESQHIDALEKVLRDAEIRSCLVKSDVDVHRLLTDEANNLNSAEFAASRADAVTAVDGNVPKDIYDYYDKMDQDETDELKKQKIILLEIRTDQIEVLQKRCQELDYPLLTEYDFKNDPNIPNIDIGLRPNAILRPYQEKKLTKNVRKRARPQWDYCTTMRCR